MYTGNETPPTPRTVQTSEFQAQCLKLLDEVAETGKEIVITKNGKPVAMLSPFQQRAKTPFGINRGRYEIIGDLDDEPLDIEWDAETGKNWQGLK